MEVARATPPSRLGYLAIALGILLVGVVVTVGVALSLGGPAETARWGAIALAIGSIVGFAPALMLVKPDSWGLLVFGSSIARMFAVLAVGYAVDSTHSLDRNAFWMSLVSGAVVVLIAETTYTVATLMKIERSKQTKAGPSVAGTEQAKA